MTKSINYPLLLLLVNLACALPSFGQESEPNNTIATADSLVLNGQLNAGSLSPRSDVDFWEFQMPSDGFVDLTLGQSSGSGSSLAQIAGLLQAADGDELIDFVSLNGLIASSTTRVGLPRANEDGAVITYVIQVGVAQFGDAQSYTLSGAFTSDSFYETEPNNQSQDSQIIEIGETYSGVTNNTDDEDWFAFGLEEDGDVRISLRKDVQGPQTGPGHQFTLFSTAIPTSAIRQNVLSSGDLESLILEGLPARDASDQQIAYLLVVTRSAAVPASQTYQLTVTVNDEGFFESIPNGSFATANPLSSLIGQNYSGRIAPRGDTDIFSFQLDDDGEVAITLSKDFIVDSNLSRFEVEIFADVNLNNPIASFLVRGDRLSNGVTLNLDRFRSNGTTIETYYALVREGTTFTEGLTDYSLSVVEIAAIQELEIRSVNRAADGGMLMFTFGSIPGTQYTLQSSTDLQSWTFVRTLTGSAGQTTVQVPITTENEFFQVTR